MTQQQAQQQQPGYFSFVGQQISTQYEYAFSFAFTQPFWFEF